MPQSKKSSKSPSSPAKSTSQRPASQGSFVSPITFEQWLVSLRGERSREEMSRLIGISSAHWSRLEAGQITNPGAEIFISLARYTTLPPEQLWKWFAFKEVQAEAGNTHQATSPEDAYDYCRNLPLEDKIDLAQRLIEDLKLSASKEESVKGGDRLAVKCR